MKRKKLLYIGNALWHKGMTPTTIHTLSQNLRDIGFKVSVASRYRSKPLRLLDMLWSVFTHRNKVDAVLIDTYSTTNFWYAVMVAKLCRIFNIAYYPILHGGELPKRLVNSPKLSRSLFGNAQSNIAPSTYLMHAFAKASLQGSQPQGGYSDIPQFDNLIHIPNSIPLADYPVKKRSDLRPKFLWVRAFAEIYNPMLALRVFAKITKEYPEAQLCMVGPKKDKSFDKCKAYATTHKLDVIFTGRLSKREWVTLSRDYDVFLNTTRVDNTPVSLIEAMALGLPIVTTDVGGIPYLLEDQKQALLVPSDGLGEMVTAIKKLLEQPKLAAQLSASGREIAQGYDWESVKSLWLKVLS